MNKLALTIAALAALSTASFAEGNHDLDGYATGRMTVHSQTVRADEETSSEGLSAFERSEMFKSEGQHGRR